MANKPRRPLRVTVLIFHGAEGADVEVDSLSEVPEAAARWVRDFCPKWKGNRVEVLAEPPVWDGEGAPPWRILELDKLSWLRDPETGEGIETTFYVTVNEPDVPPCVDGRVTHALKALATAPPSHDRPLPAGVEDEQYEECERCGAVQRMTIYAHEDGDPQDQADEETWFPATGTTGNNA